MNTSQEEARVARIQKYKEERRRQLTARTATLFSANVTDRRGKKANRSTSDENSDHHSTSAELNINTATSVPIRTTRTSRLRAAAANSADSSSSSRKSSPRKYPKSSSVQSLLEDVKQTVGSNIIDRDKNKSQVTNRRYNKERKNPSLSCSDKEIGANKTKPTHSINKNILDNSKLLVSTPKKKSDKTNVALEIKKDNLEKSVDDLENSDIVCRSKDVETLQCDNGISCSKRIEKPDIFDNIVDDKDNEVEKEIAYEYLDEGGVNPLTGLKDSYDGNIPSIVEVKPNCDLVKDNEHNDIVPNNVREDVGGLLRTVCFRKVERFSELFTSFCSPHETDKLFEDILSHHAIEEESSMRQQEPECSPPCRRTQQLPRITSTPKKPMAVAEAAGNIASLATGTIKKTRSRRTIEVPSKTENLLPPSRVSPKSAYNLSTTKATPHKTPFSNSASCNSNEKRRSLETIRASGIPLSKKCADKSTCNASATKQDSKNNLGSKSDGKSKRISPKSKVVRKSPDKLRNTENDKIRAQKQSESLNEKYHNSKKRLTSLEYKSPKDTDDAYHISSDNPLNGKNEPDPQATGDLDSSEKSEKMSMLHEIVRAHANSSRLSQELDDVATFTKQTLDRVNKLSNNLTGNKINLDVSEPRFDTLFISTSEQKNNGHSFNFGLRNDGILQSRGVSERIKDIDTAAQRLIDFEKQSAIFSDLNNDMSSQNLPVENSSTPFNHTPVSILKRKSIHEDNAMNSTQNHAIASPPVTFSPSVIEPRNCLSANRQRQGILKKRRSLDESQVIHRRSCSPEVSFADDSSSETNKPILKNRRSSLEDVVRNRSPDGQIHGILKRKMSREEENNLDDLSHGSPEPHGILKRKSNSSSSSSTASSHVSIAQAVLLAAAGGAEIVDDDKEIVRPILKKKSFSEERPCPNTASSDTPKPILKKKSIEHDEHDFDLPKKPILKSSKKISSEDGHTSSFDLSEEDRGSRRPSLLRSRTSDHSGSECDTTVRPILKQRGSSLTRERSQSPRPRLSFCADNDANISVANNSSDANDLLAAGPRRVGLSRSNDVDDSARSYFPSAVLRRRNLRPKANARSKSLVCDMNDELLSILNNRRLKVDENCENGHCRPRESPSQEGVEKVAGPKSFPSIAARIRSMEQAFIKESQVKEQATSSRTKNRDRDRYKTQPITVEEIRSITSSLEPGQASFQAFSTAGSSFPIRPVEPGAAVSTTDSFAGEPERDPFVNLAKTLDSPPYGINFFGTNSPTLGNGVTDAACAKEDDYGEATFLDFENFGILERRQSTLDEIEQEVNKVRVALDEDSRALEEDERQQAEADNWSLNVSCDSGVYNRASSRDSGPHSGEELGLIESQEIKENHATNSSSNEWSASSIERGFLTMDRERKSTETEPFRAQQEDSDEENKADHSSFGLGLVKSNSVVARASMWQQLQEQAKGTPKGPIRHSRSKAKEGSSVVDRFKTQPIDYPEANTTTQPPNEGLSLAESKSTANVLDRDEDAKLDEDDPAKLSLMEKMKMFNTKLTHKPPMAGLPKPKEERTPRTRLKTMPVLASQVQEAMEQNERLTKSLTHNDVPRNPDFQLKMELFRSASAKNTSLEYLMRQNAKFRSLDLDDELPSERAQRMITPEVRGILKSGTTVVPSKPNSLAKGESSEGLKDEGIDSSSDDETSASSVSSSEKSCSSSDSSDEIPDPKPRRFQRKNNKLKSSKTDSDLTRLQDPYPRKIQLPGANELKERLCQAKNTEAKIPLLGKLGRKASEENKKEEEDKNARYKRFVKKLDEPLQLGKLRRPVEKVAIQTEESPPPVLKISVLNQEAKNKFFGIENVKKDKNIDELAAAVRKYISPVSKSISTHAMEMPGSGSDGESSGGREVRRINSRVRHRAGGIQRSATHAEMPHKGGTIAERLAALQAAGANDWRARVCRLSPEREDTKAIERAKNMINESLNTSIDEKKKVNIEENEKGANILADRRNKLETAAQGWRKRVPQSDASLFTVAGRLERDKVSTPPMTPPPPVTASPAVGSPGVPALNKFKSRKQPSSPTNGFVSGPLRSASCAVVNAEAKPRETNRIDREAFKRSHSVSESISRLDEKEELSGAEKSGCPVRVPRADDETFQAFYAPVLQQERTASEQVEVDLDAIDSGSRQLLSSEWARRAKRERKHASRNPLRALAARTDLREEYSPPPANGPTLRDQLIKEKATANCGLAAEALAALASKEDFANVSLKSATVTGPSQGTKSKMLLHVKGRRRVQTRLVEPLHTSVNRGDCFILITPDQVFLYIGFYANVIERNRSTDIALHIYNTKDLGCKNSTGVIKIDEQSKNYNNKYWNQFWSLLGVTEGIEEYKPIETGHADEDEIFESVMVQTNMCYEVLDDELIPIKEYWGQVPKIAMLNQSKVIVFDFGSEMYIWYGKNVPLESRRKTAQLAQELFDEGYNYEDCHINPLNAALYQGSREDFNAPPKSSKSRPEWAILSKVTQHMETILFKEKFLDWPDYSRVIRVKPQESKTNSTEITPCDAEEMWSNEYQDPDLILEGSHIGRGTRYYDKETMRHYDIKTKSVCKWVIHEYDYQKVENESEIGEFFSGDSYIIRWEYQITATGRELNGKPSKHNVTGRDRCAYFCWQGKESTSNDKGAAALLTVELDREKGPQVRVSQGNEPPAFLNLFQGNLVIHQGKKDNDKSRYRLFVTRGNASNEAFLLQVPCSVRQLRCRGSLLLVDTEKGCLYIWHGARSLKHTKDVAIELANKLIARNCSYLFGENAANVKITEVKEGEESKEVLDALGVANKQYYNSILSGGKDSGGDVTPRLFHFTDLGGQFEANEVLSPLRHEHLVTPFPFDQKELYSASQPALFLLDDGAAVWLWQGWWPRSEDGELEPAEINAGVGAFAARWQAMRAAALRTSDAYWRVSRSGADGATGSSGAAHVQLVAAGLEPAAFTHLFDTWTERDDAAEANIAHGYKAGEILSGACELSRLTSCDAVLPLAALQRRPLPDHVDPHHLERHLSTPDFLEAFGMTKEEFSVLPAWKQTNLKKDVGLF